LHPAGAVPGGFHGIQKTEDTDAANPLRMISFYIAIVFVFVKFGMIQEIQTVLMGFNAKLVYLLGIPSLLGVLFGGGFLRTLSVRTGVYWTCYALWLTIGTPFSTWRGGSVPALLGYLKADIIMLFVVGGLVTNWKECTRIAAAIGLAGILNVLSGRIFAGDMGGRYGLAFGMESNPNDFAAHLLLVLPFIMYLAMSKRLFLVRIAAAIAIPCGLFFALKTASRGALVGVCVDAVLFLVLGNTRRRLSVICLAPLAAIALVAFLPSDVLWRLRSFSSSDATASEEAIGSSEARNYVLHRSIQYTFEFPIFGVGMDQFSQYEGSHNKLIGSHGYWHGTHNSFTEASSEGGILAGVFFIGGWFSAFFLVVGVNRRARKQPGCADIEQVTFYTLIGIGGFIVAITFLNFAYSFYGPAMGGLALAMKRAAASEMAKRAQRTAPGDSPTGIPPAPLRAPGLAPAPAFRY
jgi:hypothetical protein